MNQTDSVVLDSGGYVGTEWAAGTYGLVVRIGTEHGDGALKLPQLAGHTDAERALVPRLLAQEIEVIDRLREAAFNPDGCLARVMGPSATVGSADANSSHQLLLVGYGSGSPPRVCLAERTPSGWRLTPDLQLQGLDEPTLDVIAASDVSCSRWYPVAHGPSPRGGWESWYAGLPFLCYEWAPGSLCAALESGKPQRWGSAEHLALQGRLVRGLLELHTNGRVHGDVRAEHVLCRGDGSSPQEYFYAEYASVGSETIGLQSMPPGRLQVLPKRRTSPLYAPERRLQAHLPSLERARCRGNLVGDHGRECSLELVATSTEAFGTQFDVDTRLILGCSMFEVREANVQGRYALLSCAPWWSEIVDERLAVARSAAAWPSRLPVADAQVIRRSSEATDLYGLGVVATQVLLGASVPDAQLSALLSAVSDGDDGRRWSDLSEWVYALGDRPRESEICDRMEDWLCSFAACVPSAETLVRAVGNRRWALCLVWFAASCLRRESAGAFAPFCASRVSACEPGAAARRAWRALETLDLHLHPTNSALARL